MNLTPQDVEGLAGDLEEYHARFCPSFRRREQRHWALRYMEGQMLELKRKCIEPMALYLDGGNVQAMQQFISEGAWDDRAVLETHQELVDESLGEEAGVLIVDSSEFPKQGHHSVGVARQYCGLKGKVDNCQSGMFLGYSSSKGFTLLDCRLFLPEKWFGEEYRE
jgi:SRSO17 transposase